MSDSTSPRITGKAEAADRSRLGTVIAVLSAVAVAWGVWSHFSDKRRAVDLVDRVNELAMQGDGKWSVQEQYALANALDVALNQDREYEVMKLVAEPERLPWKTPYLFYLDEMGVPVLKSALLAYVESRESVEPLPDPESDSKHDFNRVLGRSATP